MQLIVSFSIKMCTELCIGNVVLCRETSIFNVSSSQGLLQFGLKKEKKKKKEKVVECFCIFNDFVEIQ